MIFVFLRKACLFLPSALDRCRSDALHKPLLKDQITQNHRYDGDSRRGKQPGVIGGVAPAEHVERYAQHVVALRTNHQVRPEIILPGPEKLKNGQAGNGVSKHGQHNAVKDVAGAGAIHPGYGFMSERADFAEICEKHGIKFIGPTAEAMRKMGDKATARKTMIENNVPVTPGTGILKTPQEVKEFAKKAGYPIILKATAGGGGKGMRIVRSDDEVETNMSLCQSEAQNFFGNPDVYAEKFLENPRHIEVQILGDQYGNVVHLGERDCSIQRRHQKLLEEAPSPAIDEATRKEMGAAAVRAAKAINYEGAGTCEFLLDHDGKWYFMEMNTRIQVEHCVTEMISNVDLVREQIMVAAGEKLDFTQEEIVLRGHAIECRINAENPEKDFMPNPGQITGYVTPGGFGVRVDSHAYQDYSIPPYYDSMIGKLICWGRTRNEARRRMYRALKEYVITGIETTIPFHQEIIEDPVFVSGKFNTGFIEDFYKRTGKDKK